MTFTIDLGGKSAVVTGGGQGVGRAICLSLAAAGARVIVNDYVPDRATLVAKEIEELGGAALASPFDVSDYAAATRAIGTEKVDILVNNAGNAGPPAVEAAPPGGRGPSVSLGEFTNTEPADWERYFAVNLYGVMNCTRAALPHMIAAGNGRIITIVSDAGRVGEPHMAPYAAAKAGAAGFTRAIAREVGRDGITVNNVALGTVDTIGLEDMARESPELAERVRRQLKRYIVPRLGQPDDVAGLITFLASPAASWITGQTYPVNGGYSVNM
ncbi:SDR family NAD(P)-dependent oxidoreductase [Parafrankia sp. FMc2]|uniref:SDR family NAD(P)-dependent oxidoreductase n=1 Tax=Parafrankia sp. FMc2 TaxID=3233196 RepID=UPI0034D53BF8